MEIQLLIIYNDPEKRFNHDSHEFAVLRMVLFLRLHHSKAST